MPQPNNPSVTNRPATFGLFPALNALLLVSGFAALFFLITNGIPLVQAGWIHELGKKGRYVRLMGIWVSAFAVHMFLMRWKFRKIFDGSCWVKLGKAVCRIPLRYTAAGFSVEFEQDGFYILRRS